jgi:hypothetical protein
VTERDRSLEKAEETQCESTASGCRCGLVERRLVRHVERTANIRNAYTEFW